MEKKSWIDIAVGASISIALFPVSGHSFIGGIITGYLQNKDSIRSSVYGLLVGTLTLVLWLIYRIAIETIQGTFQGWWHIAYPVVLNSGAILFFACIGGIIGQYLRQEK